jgi:hypothetical protein
MNREMCSMTLLLLRTHTFVSLIPRDFGQLVSLANISSSTSMQVPARWLSTVDQTEVGVIFVFCVIIHPLSDSTGLLIGACVNRAPEGTFGAAVAQVGVMDLLKVTSDVLCRYNEIRTKYLSPSFISLPLVIFSSLLSYPDEVADYIQLCREGLDERLRRS